MTLEQLIYDKISNLSPGQRKVAEYILENIECVSYATLAKLSKEISVSETTIIRLSYSLGFDSFSAMQQKLREDILTTPHRSLPETSTPNSTIANTLKKETDAFLSWSSSLNENLIRQIADILLSADKILVIGARSSFSAASWLGNRLNLLLGNTYIIQEFYDPRFDLLSNVTEKTAVISLAFARYTKWTYHYANMVKKHGAKLIAITDTPSSPFYGISDHAIQAAPLKDEMGFSSFVCLYCLFDLLLARLREKRHDLINQRLKLYESTYSEFDFFYE